MCGGTLYLLLHTVTDTGLSPACAGEPADGLRCVAQQRVYPRVCGGTRIPKMVIPICAGLSPRVRGNLSWAAAWRQHPGSIPACAGEPAGASITVPSTGVYPRVCGGTCWIQTMTERQTGLSPRVRGNPLSVSLVPY